MEDAGPASKFSFGRCFFLGRARKPPLVCSLFVWLRPGRNSLCHLSVQPAGIRDQKVISSWFEER